MKLEIGSKLDARHLTVPRIGLLYPSPNPISPDSWSGSPAGLASGLERCGAEVRPIGNRLPSGLHHVVAACARVSGTRWAAADRSPLMRSLRTRSLARNLAAAGDLDAVIAMGTEMYDLGALRHHAIPWVTYDDGTLRQMWEHPESDIRNSGFRNGHVNQWISHQMVSSHAASLCCVSTEWASRSFIGDYGIPATKVHIVGMGHRPRNSTSRPQRHWSVPRFLFVGVDWRRKNGDAVVNAFMSVRRHYPEATLDLVGAHPKIDVPGVTGHGFLPRSNPAAQATLDQLFAKSTVFVLPSRFDPSPIAYLEAASAGLPVIATTEGGGAEALGDGAIRVHPDDQTALVKAMYQLGSPETARTVGASAQTAAAAATWTLVAGRILTAAGLNPNTMREEEQVR